MDHVVCSDSCVNGNVSLEDKCLESCVNEKLTKAFVSPKERKSRSSSNESVYEVIAELSNEDSENEAVSDYEDKYKHCNSLLNSMDSDYKMNHKQEDDPTVSVEMDEVFIIVEDDANDVLEDRIVSRNLSDAEEPTSLNCDGIKSVKEQEEKISAPGLSEKEDIKKSALGDLVLTRSEKSDTAVLSSEDDDGMDDVLEEFRKNDFENDSSVTKRLEELKSTVINEKTEDLSDGKMKSFKSEQKSPDQNINTICSVTPMDPIINSESDCIIVCDNEEKSNISDSSSIEILNDDSMNEADNSLMCKESNKQIFTINSQVHKSPSFSSSEGDKSDFGNMILNIVDEAIPERDGDISLSGSNQNTVLINATSQNILDSSSICASGDKFDKCNLTSEKVHFGSLTNNPDKIVDSCVEENSFNLDASNSNSNKINNDSKSVCVSSGLLPNSTVLKDDTYSESDLKSSLSQMPTVNIISESLEVDTHSGDIKSFSEETSTVVISKSVEKEIHSESDFEMLSAEEISKSEKEDTFCKPDLKTLSAEKIVKSETGKTISELNIKIASTEMTKMEISECTKEVELSESGTVKIVSTDEDISKKELSYSSVTDEANSKSTNIFSAELSTVEISESAKEKEFSESDLKSVSTETSTVEMSKNLHGKTNSESGVKHISSEISTLEMPASLNETENSELGIKHISEEISTAEMPESFQGNAKSESDIKHISAEICIGKMSENVQEKAITESDIKHISAESCIDKMSENLQENAITESDMKHISAEMSAVEMSESLNENEVFESDISHISAEKSAVEMPLSLPKEVNSEHDVKHIPAEISMVKISENLQEKANTESDIKHISEEISENINEKTNSESSIKHISAEIPTEGILKNSNKVIHSESEINIVPIETSTVGKSTIDIVKDPLNKCSGDLCEKEKEEILQSTSAISPVKMEIDESEQSHEVETDTKTIKLENKTDVKVLQTSQMETDEPKAEDYGEVKKEELDTSKDEIIDETQAEKQTHVKTSDGDLKWTVKSEACKSEPVMLNSSDNEIQSNSDFAVKRKLIDPGDNDKIKKLKTDIKEEDKENSTFLSGTEALASDFESRVNDSIRFKSDTSSVDYPAMEDISFLNMKHEDMFISRKELKAFAQNSLEIIFKKHYSKEHAELKNIAEDMKKSIEMLTTNFRKLRVEFFDLREAQKATFDAHNYTSKVTTRTVGVNVKIYKESDFQQALAKLESSNRAIPKTEETELKPAVPLQNNKRESVPSQSATTSTMVIPKSNAKDYAISSLVAPQQNAIGKTVLPRALQGISPVMPQRIAPPNVTVCGNQLISIGRPPSTHSVVLVPSSSITSVAKNNSGTKEQILQRTMASGVPTPTTTVAKATLPGMPNTSNVLVPIRDYLQLLPPGAKGTSLLRPAGVPRPTIIPPLPSGLVGTRTVTYFVPQNSGIGGRGIPPFMQQSNQQVQFLLRVTNPGSTPVLNSSVNTISKSPSVPVSVPVSQLPVTSAGPHPSSGLILISHTTKHPAPFPKSPHYPDDKGKSIPPKPSLKGSKSANGIVLSWNMCLFRHSANISNYQLFAYQETDGPVDASLWKKVGDVNALPLPMACTLTQFVDKNRYYFTVRAVDVFQRFGPFSDPVSILYEKECDSGTKK